MISKTFNIVGMTSGVCSSKLERALNALPDITASVSLGNASATVSSHKPIKQEVIVEAINKCGFSVKFI